MSCPVALVVIYNHQYNQNIERVERIYRDRFPDIYHLVPFYRGEKENVIPVYDSSYCFQGYVAQAIPHLPQAAFDHFLFIADDMILNPVVTAENYREQMGLASNSCFIPGLVALHTRQKWWWHTPEAFAWDVRQPGVEAANQLPDAAVAAEKLRALGIEMQPLRLGQIFRTPLQRAFWKSPRASVREGIKGLWMMLTRREKRAHLLALSYPMASSYSDIFVIDRNTLKSFGHLCGVFAATRLFVEVAIPTAIALAAEHVVTEKDLALKGKALWTPEEMALLDPYGFDVTRLLEDFPSGHLYLHPIKLSKWKLPTP
jgi:hypothetical protein